MDSIQRNKNHLIDEEKMKERRNLKFQTYSEIIQDIELLQKNGYIIGAKWNLGQICKHISYFMRGSLEGFPMMFPWIIRVTFGKMLLKNLLSTPRSKPGKMTDPKSIYEAEPDETKSILEAIEFLKRLDKNTEKLKPSSIFGDISNEEWNILHKRHFSHHLSFLHPKKV